MIDADFPFKPVTKKKKKKKKREREKKRDTQKQLQHSTVAAKKKKNKNNKYIIIPCNVRSKTAASVFALYWSKHHTRYVTNTLLKEKLSEPQRT